MRSIWKGAIAFGLVNVPVKVYSATEDHDLELHQVHEADGGRIRYQRRCEVCGKKVDYDHIDKAYEHGEQTVILTDHDLSALPEEKSREIEVLEFVPSDQIDPIMLARSYFLAPDGKAVKAYTLLRRALEETERTAIVQFTLRQKTRLGALRVHDDVLLLQGLLWDDEVREGRFPELDETPRISAKEKEMSTRLVESLSGDFAPDSFTDEYQEQLRQLVEAKLQEGDALDTEATFGETDEGEDAEVVDLMEALKRSVDRSKTSGKGSTKESSDKKTPEKKAPAKKTPAKKTAAKKTAAKKTSAKKNGTKKGGAGKKAAAKKQESARKAS